MKSWPLAVMLIALATPGWAQSATQCRGDARNLQRDLAVQGGNMTPDQRLRAQQRLGAGEALCVQDPRRGSSDLEQFRRDMVQQAQRPPTGPSPSPLGGSPSLEQFRRDMVQQAQRPH